MTLPRRALQGARASACSLAAAVLAACSSGPPTPDWQLDAQAALQRATQAYLSGETRIAELEFARAQRELARTGRAELMARGELTRCAAQFASLEVLVSTTSRPLPCPGFEVLRADAGAAEVAYADFLGAALDAQRLVLLPAAQQAAAAAAADAERRVAAVRAIEDPLSRLVAAAASLRDGVAPPGLVDTAIDTASAQGWRRPLLAWLTLQLKRAEAAGDRDAAGQLRRRIDRVSSSGVGLR